MPQEKLPTRVKAKEGGMNNPKEERLTSNLSQTLKSRVRSPLEAYKSLEEQTQGATEAGEEEEQTTGEIISALCSKFFHAIPPVPYLSTSPIPSRGQNIESYFEFQPADSPATAPGQDDDIDIAMPVSGSRPSNYFLNAMTTVSGYTGVDSFVNLKNHLHKATEGLEKIASKSSTSYPNITYDVDMSDSDTESDGDADSFSEPRDILRFPKPGEDTKLDIVEEEKVTTEFNDHIPRQELSRIPSTGSNSTKSFHTTYSHKPIDSNTDGANEIIDKLSINGDGANEITDKLSINDDLQEFYDDGSHLKSMKHTESTTSRKRTIFEQSIVDNLDPFIIKETVLVKVKEGENLANSDFEANKELISLNIAEKLKRVFELSDDDYFYGNYNAWLVKDVLLQGHLYLTRDCIFFFAFFPKKNSNINQVGGDGYTDSDDYATIQQGSLGMKSAKYGDAVFTSVITHRYWAILRSQTLTIYSSSTDLYFPNFIIDLKTCIRTEIIEKEKEKEKEDVSNNKNQPPLSRGSSEKLFYPKPSRSSSTLSSDMDSETSSLAQETSSFDESPDGVGVGGGAWFKLISKNKTYKFHTDNLYSARQWCNNLTKLIFQLQNSNATDEVLIKIPIENVIDFSKIGFFNRSEEEENSDSENEDDKLPLSFRLTFLDNDEDQQSLLSAKGMKNKLKLSTKTEVNGVKTSYGVDDIFFLFFGSGKSFYNVFSQIVYDHRKAQDAMSLVPRPDRFMDRAKRIVTRGSKSSLDFSEKVPVKGISTLNPMKPSSTILARVQSYNNRSLQSQQTLESSSTTSEIAKSEQSSVSSNKSTIKKIGRRLSNPTKMFTSKKSRETVPTLSRLPSDEKGAETEHVAKIHLPRPFSLSALKNLEMSFETSHTDVRTAETKYEARHEGLDPKSKSQPQAELLASSNNLQDTPLPGPLYLSDPSEYIGENKKQNKLKVITKSIKSFSNVSSMWSSNPIHFIEEEADDPFFVNDVTTRDATQDNFRDHFSLDSKNNLVATYYAHLQKSIPIYGKVYLGNNVLCFRSLLPGVSTKMILPLKDVENCFKEKGLKLTYSGLVVVIRGYEEIFFEFSNQQARDDCETVILKQLEAIHQNDSWMPKPHEWGHNYDMELSRTRQVNSSSNSNSLRPDIRLETKKIESARIKLFEDRINAAIGLDIPIILEDSPFHKIEIKPSTSFNIVLLTIGSRGDVQTYIALGKGLIAEGHNVTIATHGEYGDWIEKHGLKFKEIAGNPAELMSLMVTHGSSMSVSFLKEAGSKFRGWIHDLLRSSWDACQGADLLIESPSAMGGVHIAEALGIPYMRAFTMPWTRTRAYPHAFIVPDQKKGGSYNYLTHIMFESVFWKGISGQVNKWRIEDLGLPKTNLNKLQQTKIPFFYNVSPSIFPPSVDFPDWVKVTGYWFLDEGAAEDFDPPAELVEFMEQASKDQKKIVYIGFGSIVVSDAKSLTKAIVEAVLDADVRCVLNKGWSDRLTNKDKNEPEIELPPEVYNSGTIPHDWLFPKLDAAVHHGGSGTTGATLRSGLPTIIKPFFGDQFFYGSRVEDVGVGICLKKLNAKSLSKSIQTVTSDLKMIEKAKKISDRINRENGVLTAIEAIYSELEYARNLIVTKQKYNESHGQQIFDNRTSGAQTPVVYEEDEDDEDDDDDADVEDDDFSDTDEETDLNEAASKASDHEYGYEKELTESQSA